GWYRKAADAGHHDAEYRLGLLLEQQNQSEEAEGWYRKAADAGHHDAEHRLGLLLEQPNQSEEHEAWYRKAAGAAQHGAGARPMAAIAGQVVTGWATRLRLHGRLDQIGEKYLALPHRRLVVLGEPGAGKTVLAILLTLSLLERRQSGEPVPVLLGLASWDPMA